MSKTRGHPKTRKYCVFCHYWTGDADLRYIPTAREFEYEYGAQGRCAKAGIVKQSYASCSKFTPSIEASKYL